MSPPSYNYHNVSKNTLREGKKCIKLEQFSILNAIRISGGVMKKPLALIQFSFRQLDHFINYKKTNMTTSIKTNQKQGQGQANSNSCLVLELNKQNNL